MVGEAWQLLGLGSGGGLLEAENEQAVIPAHPRHWREKLKQHLHSG